MSESRIRWSLGAKLALVGAPFLFLAVLSTAATLWVSWQLDGGAAAVNEAGRMRMQAYRMALSAGTHEMRATTEQIAEFETSLNLLRNGDADRPLFIPWDPQVHEHFSQVEGGWHEFRELLYTGGGREPEKLQRETSGFVAEIDALVAAIEKHISYWTAILHLLQMGVLGLALLGACVLMVTGYLFVLEPVGMLKQAIQRIVKGDLGARVAQVSSDEFGTLAQGFNSMAEHLQSMYRNLENKVQEKTAELEVKRERLESLYEVTALMARATTLDELAQGFSRRIMKIAHADGVAIRWSDQANQRYMILAAMGLPQSMVEEEQCLHAGTCHCGSMAPSSQLKVIPIQAIGGKALGHCEHAGFATVINVPIMLHERYMGEVALFFHAGVTPNEAERSLLEALTSHLANGMENLRLNALEKEAAVSAERQLLANELHDSIAQALIFLKIQVQLMQDALANGDPEASRAVLQEIDVGVRECYGDVRELLLHFRTRANAEDIEPALVTTLKKFEHQSGIAASLSMEGDGLPLSPDVQIQVLHIVQEALSNVRKHAQASHVWLMVQQQPVWRFEIRDDGRGFEAEKHTADKTHVGLEIMQERAQRIQATLDVVSTPERGTSVVLTLPASAPSQLPQEAQGGKLSAQASAEVH